MVAKDSKAAVCAMASSISTPGITGRCGKWPTKNGSLMVTFFSALMLLPFSYRQHAVHQQERIAVRQLLEDFVDVHHESVFFSRALMRSRSLCSCLSVAAFFSHAALSSMGKMPV